MRIIFFTIAKWKCCRLNHYWGLFVKISCSWIFPGRETSVTLLYFIFFTKYCVLTDVVWFNMAKAFLPHSWLYTCRLLRDDRYFLVLLSFLVCYILQINAHVGSFPFKIALPFFLICELELTLLTWAMLVFAGRLITLHYLPCLSTQMLCIYWHILTSWAVSLDEVTWNIFCQG